MNHEQKVRQASRIERDAYQEYVVNRCEGGSILERAHRRWQKAQDALEAAHVAANKADAEANEEESIRLEQEWLHDVNELGA